MKQVSALLIAISFLIGASNADAFDIKRGRWVAFTGPRNNPDSVMTFHANDKKDFKGYYYSDTGLLLRLTGNVNDGLKSRARILIERRGNGFFDSAKTIIRGRAKRFTATYRNAVVNAFWVGSTNPLAGGYRGFNSFGESVIMIILPDGDVMMKFKSEDSDITLTGKARQRFFTVSDKEEGITVNVVISGNGQLFRGNWVQDGRAFRLFGEALPETPEDLE